MTGTKTLSATLRRPACLTVGGLTRRTRLARHGDQLVRTRLVAVAGTKEDGDNVNLAKRTFLFAVCALVAGATVRGDVTGSKDNPYKLILENNPFRLKDPPRVTKEPATNVVNLDVRFTGITSIGRTKRAWLVIPPGPGRSQPKYLNNLSEGDGDGVLQIVEINEKEETVKILNAGVTVVLNFHEHGLPAPAAAVVPLPVSGVAFRTVTPVRGSGPGSGR